MAILHGFDHSSPGLHMFHYKTDHFMDFKLSTNKRIELWCFMGGNAKYYVEGIEYNVKPGDLIVLRPGESHYPMVDFSVPYERASVLIREELLKPLMGNDTLLAPVFNREPGTRNLYRADAFDRDPRYYFKKMCQSAADERTNILIYSALLLQQIGIAFRKNQFTEPSEDSIGHRILLYINQNLHKDLSMDALCRKFYISKSQLGRISKKVTGLPAGQYITAKRMQKAQQLIDDGNKPTRICTACGYTNYASFYRAYIKIFGHSPKAEALFPGAEDVPDTF